MGFLQVKRDSIYLDIDSSPKPIRPLYKEAIGKWVRSIPPCSIVEGNKKRTLRRFRTVDADFSRWFNGNPDPLWEQLEQSQRFNRNNDRVDFPLRLIHMVPVWSYSDQLVKIAKQGNQFFEEMVVYYDTGGDVTTCDWLCWTEGSGMQTRYKTSRQDPKPFQSSLSEEAIKQQCVAAMEQAIADLLPFKDEADMLRYIYGQTEDEATPSISGVNTQYQTPQMPHYQPGGQPQQALATTMPQSQGVPNFTQHVPQSMPAQQSYPGTPNFAQPSHQQAQFPNFTQHVPQSMPAQQSSPGIPNFAQPHQQVQLPNFAQPQQTQLPNFTQPAHQQAQEVPNAPISTPPVFAPPQPVQTTYTQQAQTTQLNDRSMVIDFGKHRGKSLEWIRDNDAAYLSFLKGNKKELIPAIEQVLSASNPQLPGQPSPQIPNGNNGDERGNLVKKINDGILKIPDFQGIGIAQNLMPFLKEVIGTTNYSDASIEQLRALNEAVSARLGV